MSTSIQQRIVLAGCPVGAPVSPGHFRLARVAVPTPGPRAGNFGMQLVRLRARP